MITRLLSKNSDFVGIVASGLCAIHCAITPLIFMAKPLLQNASADTTFSCADAPMAWKAFDFIFLFIGFYAVWISSKHSSKVAIKSLMWISWIILAAGILLAKFVGHGPMYVGSIGLVSMHIWNIRTCRVC